MRIYKKSLSRLFFLSEIVLAPEVGLRLYIFVAVLKASFTPTSFLSNLRFEPRTSCVKENTPALQGDFLWLRVVWDVRTTQCLVTANKWAFAIILLRKKNLLFWSVRKVDFIPERHFCWFKNPISTTLR